MTLRVAWEWISTKIVSPRRSSEAVTDMEGFFTTKQFPKHQVSIP